MLVCLCFTRNGFCVLVLAGMGAAHSPAGLSNRPLWASAVRLEPGDGQLPYCLGVGTLSQGHNLRVLRPRIRLPPCGAGCSPLSAWLLGPSGLLPALAVSRAPKGKVPPPG